MNYDLSVELCILNSLAYRGKFNFHIFWLCVDLVDRVMERSALERSARLLPIETRTDGVSAFGECGARAVFGISDCK